MKRVHPQWQKQDAASSLPRTTEPATVLRWEVRPQPSRPRKAGNERDLKAPGHGKPPASGLGIRWDPGMAEAIPWEYAPGLLSALLLSNAQR